MAATETRSREELAAAISELATACNEVSYELWPLSINREEAALLLDALEPPKPVFEGWADVELMGHRSRIAYVRELELAHRGFLELTWRSGEVELREIYSPSAVFCMTPLEGEQQANDLRAARNGGYVYPHVPDDADGEIPF